MPISEMAVRKLMADKLTNRNYPDLSHFTWIENHYGPDAKMLAEELFVAFGMYARDEDYKDAKIARRLAEKVKEGTLGFDKETSSLTYKSLQGKTIALRNDEGLRGSIVGAVLRMHLEFGYNAPNSEQHQYEQASERINFHLLQAMSDVHTALYPR